MGFSAGRGANTGCAAYAAASPPYGFDRVGVTCATPGCAAYAAASPPYGFDLVGVTYATPRGGASTLFNVCCAATPPSSPPPRRPHAPRRSGVTRQLSHAAGGCELGRGSRRRPRQASRVGRSVRCSALPAEAAALFACGVAAVTVKAPTACRPYRSLDPPGAAAVTIEAPAVC